MFWVISARGKTNKKGNDFSKKRYFLRPVLIFNQIKKFYNAKAAELAIPFVLKKLSQLFEKAVTTVIR